jgi:putative CocE/NonD family hydrolase
MRDGVKLATDIYRPSSARRYPVILVRLPYNKDQSMIVQENIDTSRAVQAGYIVVIQDCRGRFASEGRFYTGRQ